MQTHIVGCSFKERGARFALHMLDSDAKKVGVIAASAGMYALWESSPMSDISLQPLNPLKLQATMPKRWHTTPDKWEFPAQFICLLLRL
jgi:hypothetical protein